MALVRSLLPLATVIALPGTPLVSRLLPDADDTSAKP
jgi:hypothetical protein